MSTSYSGLSLLGQSLNGSMRIAHSHLPIFCISVKASSHGQTIRDSTQGQCPSAVNRSTCAFTCSWLARSSRCAFANRSSSRAISIPSLSILTMARSLTRQNERRSCTVMRRFWTPL